MKRLAEGVDRTRGASVEIGSINRAISFLGAERVAKHESVRPLAGRADDAARARRQDGSVHEPAYETHFSKQALERGQSTPVGLGPDETGLSEKEQSEVRDLRQRDREVRAHEQAHKAAAGRHAIGGPSFEFQRGPDGRRYAVGGEVQIDVSPVAGDPSATIQKMRQVASAARAPANPSSADQRVAATAAKQETAARAEIQEEKRAASAPETTLPNATREHASSSKSTGYSASHTDRRGSVLDLVA